MEGVVHDNEAMTNDQIISQLTSLRQRLLQDGADKQALAAAQDNYSTNPQESIIH